MAEPDARSPDVEPDSRSERRWRIAGGVGITIVTIAAVVGSAFLSVLYAFNCLDGDGGVPYVARDSAQKDVCGATGNGLILFALMAAAAGAFAYLASRLLARWRARQGPLLLGLAAMAGIIVAPLLGFWAVNLPSNQCSDEQEAANEQWERSGSGGEPPYDCDHY